MGKNNNRYNNNPGNSAKRSLADLNDSSVKCSTPKRQDVAGADQCTAMHMVMHMMYVVTLGVVAVTILTMV